MRAYGGYGVASTSWLRYSPRADVHRRVGIPKSTGTSGQSVPPVTCTRLAVGVVAGTWWWCHLGSHGHLDAVGVHGSGTRGGAETAYLRDANYGSEGEPGCF